MKYIFTITLILFVLISPCIHAQIGGNSTYSFLNNTASARIAAMGGDFLAIGDNDITLAPSNPSLINPGLNNQLGVAYVDFFSDINYGTASYSRTFDNVGSFVASMKYMNYGNFEYADEAGNRNGNFNASESAFALGWGRELDSTFSIGANMKFIYSSFESYSSYGLAVDIAGSYRSDDRNFMMSLIAKNIGRQLKAYNGGNNEPLPFELQFGLSKRLSHLPFRYSLLVNNLEKWDLRYDDPSVQNTDPITGEVIKDGGAEVFFDNMMRHLVFGGELLIGKNLSLRGGYNYRRRQELKVASKTAMVGFSWGVGIRISKFHISYSRSTYHLSGSPNYITLSTNLGDFFVKNN
ncbi:MAG: type IX secretion system protein PorQ [Chlorobi bacterium]|nr:type IX secretion system protein PorQ [Chlorobiota bacterium]